jgi:16S rRNA (guanine966-N2)-methyltransferase
VGRIRIIAGELRGRRMRVPEGREVRPTADRVREALFSILGARVAGARVLDAYAGSGALGFEALSRGAAEVLFIESDGKVARLLRDNGRDLGLEGCFTVRTARAADWLEQESPEVPFHLILADPPYEKAEIERFLPLAASPRWLSADGWIVVERGRSRIAVESAGTGIARFRSAVYGRSGLDFYRRVGWAEPETSRGGESPGRKPRK